jgi:hypothetical protein
LSHSVEEANSSLAMASILDLLFFVILACIAIRNPFKCVAANGDVQGKARRRSKRSTYHNFKLRLGLEKF